MKDEKIGIIGAGNMGEALIRGIMRRGFSSERLITSDKDRKRRDYIRRKYRICVVSDNLKVLASSKIVILAIKPQDMNIVLEEVKYQISNIKYQILFISIAAGITTRYIENFLGEVPVIRVMPNAPALIGEGISAICLGKYAKQRDYYRARDLFRAVGDVLRVKESLLDKVTAISGSGPAYFFLLMKCMKQAGVRLGLSKEIVERLVNHTARGSIEMIVETKQTPGDLIKRVASRGGTTEAALEIFAKRKLEKIIEEGIKAALRRGKELRRN